MQNLKVIIVGALLFVGASSCFKRVQKTSCKDVFCTMEFRSIDIGIVSVTGNQEPFNLRVTDLNNNQVIRTGIQNVNNNTQAYTIADDLDMKHLSQILVDEPFKVEVLRNDSVLVSEIYSLVKDCCHINKANGPDFLTIP